MKLPFLLLVLAASAAVAAESFRWNGNVPAGKAIEIKAVNGGIRAERSASGSVEVTAEKSARRSDPSEVRIEVINHAEGVTICAVYPGDDNMCTAGKENKMRVKNNDVQVKFMVRVPAGVNLVARTVNGSVDAKDIPGDVLANTVNGDVSATATGLVEGRTVNGNVTVNLGAVPGRALSFHTVNGNVDVTMPGGSGAELDARTVNGQIQSDFPMQVQGSLSPKHVKARLGGGGAELKVDTVNGNVRIHSGR
jgi:hypothetical protein